MKQIWTRFGALALCLFLIIGLCPVPNAAEDAGRDITAQTALEVAGYDSKAFLTDGDIGTYRTSGKNAAITLTNAAGLGGVYLLFDLNYSAYTLVNNDTGATATVGEESFLHQYLNLEKIFGTAPKSVTLQFGDQKVRISEIYALSVGTPPEFVQVWDAPLEGKADLVLFATHGDDDQLFFAGLLPKYSAVCAVQVVYMTDHRSGPGEAWERMHEMLNGLWAVGVRAYPVFGKFEDFRIDDKQATYEEFAAYGHSRQELQGFVVEQIRRFKPQVAVGHDLAGEYGHGMHMVYAELLTLALEMTNDAEQFPESAEKYGLWDVPKTYLHLYEENPVQIDYDMPMEEFDGMTPFQVTQKLGYPCHKSQQWTWFTDWINGYSNEITKAIQIQEYNPCQFGLYRTTVGADVQKDDFLENIVTYAEQERLEQERLEQERLEQERLEQERLEQERLEQERQEAARLEAERLEKERLEQERAQQEKRQALMAKIVPAAILGGVLVVALLAVLVYMGVQKRARKKRN